MSSAHVVVLVLYGIGMAFGQALFKLAADRSRSGAHELSWALLFSTGYFYLAIAIYGILAVIWIWILARVPLSRAYPFVALSFAFTPLFAVLFFDESVNSWYVMSLALILLGLGLLLWKAT
jgi:drug/metabolite transporter (DMT)-like permease